MSKRTRFWFLVYPDISKPIGGVKQIHRLAEALNRLGHSATLVQEDKCFRPQWFSSDINAISLNTWNSLLPNLTNDDFVVIPETFLAVVNQLPVECRIIIYNQNSSYTFGVNYSQKHPSLGSQKSVLSILHAFRCYHSHRIAQVFCVSDYDLQFLRIALGLSHSKVSKIVNPVDQCFLSTPRKKKLQICYMPRKNSSDSLVVLQLLKRSPLLSGWSFVPIVNVSQSQVAHIMSESLIFLSFGHPEGFGLPVAEALASGCYVIGYDGLGGRELFELALRSNSCTSVAFNDWTGFLVAVEKFITWFNNDPKSVSSSLLSTSNLVRRKYCFDYLLHTLPAILRPLINS